MKKILLLIITLILLTASVAAQDTYTGNEIILNETLTDNTYAMGGQISQDGEINGDLMAFGSQIKINGRILEDLSAASSQITVDGVIGGDLRAAGSQITINGLVFGDLVLAGTQIKLLNQTNIGRNTYISASSIYFDAIADENVALEAGHVEWGENAYIKGNLKIPENVNVPEGIVAGEITRIQYESPFSGLLMPAVNLAGALLTLAMMLLLGVVLIWIFKKYFDKSKVTFIQRPLISFLIGIATLIVVPVVAGIIFITFVGIPISILLFLAYITLLIAAPILTAIAAGKMMMRLFNGEGTTLLNLLIGAILLILVSWIPIVGPIVITIAFIMAVGALVRNLFGTDKEKKQRKRRTKRTTKKKSNKTVNKTKNNTKKKTSKKKASKKKASKKKASKKKQKNRTKKLEI